MPALYARAAKIPRVVRRGMIPAAPLGWTQRCSANLVVYEAPDGANRVRCYQNLPLEPVSKAVARVLGDSRIEEVTRVVTAEGEYGALCRVDGARVVGSCSRIRARSSWKAARNTRLSCWIC